MFGEPAWDLLLTIYVHDEKRAVLTISQLAELANTPMTTALRWIDYLEETGLIVRDRSSADERASAIALSDHGRAQLQSYFAEVRELMRSLATGGR
jgi:DNA-binding MarR family transcriptional regulator